MMHTSTSLIRRTTRLLACTPLLGTLAAQALVSPSLNRTREGNWGDAFPFFSTALPEEYLQLHGDVPGARTISWVALRPDGNNSNLAADMDCTLWLSNAPPGVSHAAPAAAFAGNHGTNLTGAMQVNLNFAAQPYQDGEPWPRSFAYSIPVPVPFNSSGASDLVWHLRVNLRRATGSGYCDSVRGTAGPWNAVTSYGAGCSIDSSSPPAQLSTSMGPGWVGGSMQVDLNAVNMSPNLLVAFAIGASPALPPLLLPGSGGAPSGPCYAHLSPAVYLYGVADSMGIAPLSFAAPEPTSGVNYYTQAIGLAPGANPMGLITSNADHTYLAPPINTMAPVGFLHQVGNAPITVTPHGGFVVELR